LNLPLSSLHLNRRPLEPCPGSVPRNVTLAVRARWFTLTFSLVTFGRVESRNVAVTDVSSFSVTLHVPVPEQPPPFQPLNFQPAACWAWIVTAVPPANRCETVLP